MLHTVSKFDHLRCNPADPHIVCASERLVRIATDSEFCLCNLGSAFAFYIVEFWHVNRSADGFKYGRTSVPNVSVVLWGGGRTKALLEFLDFLVDLWPSRPLARRDSLCKCGAFSVFLEALELLLWFSENTPDDFPAFLVACLLYTSRAHET